MVAVAVTTLLYICKHKFCRWCSSTTKQSSRSVEGLASERSIPTTCDEGLEGVSPSVTDLRTGDARPCRMLKAGRVRKDSEWSLDVAHLVSGGAVCFARALNDTPKMAALLVIHRVLDTSATVGAVALAMIAGGLIYGRPVAHTLSKKITPMSRDQGFMAGLSTALVVVLATKFGLPVSTTHVSVGSLFGIGLLSGHVNRIVIWHIALSWFFIIPCGAAFAGGIYWLIR
jgi:phosphate/sulfate permease